MTVRQRQLFTYLCGALLLVLFLALPLHTSYAAWSDWLPDLGFTEWIKGSIFSTATSIGGLFLVVGGGVLDYSIRELIVNMGTWFNGSQGGSGQSTALGQAVTLGWTFVRDLLNMAFIFALIYIGVKTILDAQNSDTRRLLGLLIAAALLINFSLFITQTVVDFTNVIATKVYEQIVVEPGSAYNPQTASISSSFIDLSNLMSWYNADGSSSFSKMSLSAAIFFSALMMFFMIIAGFMFLFGSILVVTRFVALILYMIFSPLMFIGWILPWFSNIASQWREGFFKYAFFGPLYLFMIYISLVIFRQMTADFRDDRTFGSNLDPDSWATFTVPVVYFMIMIGFLYASLIIGDKLSIAGSKLTLQGVDRLKRGAQRGARGMGYATAGFGYRWTGGLAAAGARNAYDYMDRGRESKSRLKSWAGFAGTRLMGGEDGRAAIVKARQWSPSGVSQESIDKRTAERSSRMRGWDRDDNVAAILNGTSPGKSIGDLADREVVEMMKKDSSRGKILDQAGSLTPSQIKAISGDKDIDVKTLNELKEKHKASLKERMKKAGEFKKIAEQYKNDSKEIASALGKDIDNDEVAEYLVQNMGMIENMGSYVTDTNVQKSLVARMNSAAKKNGLQSELNRKLKNSRTWTV